jgi:hypothetical protein
LATVHAVAASRGDAGGRTYSGAATRRRNVETRSFTSTCGTPFVRPPARFRKLSPVLRQLDRAFYRRDCRSPLAPEGMVVAVQDDRGGDFRFGLPAYGTGAVV